MAEQLRFPYRIHFIHRFQFTDYNIFNKDV